jgi:hypothetical protein
MHNNVYNLFAKLIKTFIFVSPSCSESNRANINKDVETRWEPEIHYAIDDEISKFVYVLWS